MRDDARSVIYLRVNAAEGLALKRRPRYTAVEEGRCILGEPHLLVGGKQNSRQLSIV